jgi:hypothetical protein
VSGDTESRDPSNDLRSLVVEIPVTLHLPVRNRSVWRLRRRMVQHPVLRLAALGRIFFVLGIPQRKSRGGLRQHDSVGFVGREAVVDTVDGWEEEEETGLNRPAVVVRPCRPLNNSVAAPSRTGTAAQSDSPNLSPDSGGSTEVSQCRRVFRIAETTRTFLLESTVCALSALEWRLASSIERGQVVQLYGVASLVSCVGAKVLT